MARPVLTPNAWLRWDIVRRHLDSLGASLRILEIGMGQGAVGARLAERGTYTGIEPDAASREVAASRLPATATVLTDLDLVEPGAEFDVVCAFEVVEHIEDDLGAVRAWVPHVRPGGDMVLSVPANPERFAAADRLAGHFRRYSRAQLRALLDGAGLEVVRIDATGFPLGYVLETGRNQIAARRSHRLSSIEEQTAASGRFLQPPAAAAPLTQALTYPFRKLQRPFRATDLGTGWVAIGRRPIS